MFAPLDNIISSDNFLHFLVSLFMDPRGVSLDSSLLSTCFPCGCARRFQRGPQQITLQSKVPVQATKARIRRNESYRLSFMGSFFKQKVECRLNIPLFLREQEAFAFNKAKGSQVAYVP